jgi:hypothetical protein
VDGPFEWRVAGQSLWIVSGRIERAAVLSVLSAGNHATLHLASLVVAEPHATIAIGLRPDHPQELLWTTCYGSPGHSGSIEFTKDGRPFFVYR